MPIFNVYKMMSMQKATLVAYNGINDQVGLTPIAGEDGSSVALLIASRHGGDVNITLVNLPSAFQSGSFSYAEYQIDPYTSNLEPTRASRECGGVRADRRGGMPVVVSMLTLFGLGRRGQGLSATSDKTQSDEAHTQQRQ
jgi:hypothetical protein